MALSGADRIRDARPQVLFLDDLPVVTKARPDGFGNRRSTRTYFILAAEPDIAANAANAAWLLVQMLAPKKPAEADRVAKLASDLKLVSPRLTDRAARTAEAGGGPAIALALIDMASAHQGGSTDRAWADLLSYRDAVAARQVAAGRIPAGPAPYRTGHTAPADRPDRRRFKLDTSAVTRPAAPVARKRGRTTTRSSSR
jgi:hypothetical protein